MATICVGGAEVEYRVDGTGPGLVLVHGTGGDADTNWGALTEPLAQHWRVVRPNYSGSGRTRDEGGELTVAELAAQVVAAAEAAGAAPFDLVGFSLGAAVATYVAAEYPWLVRRVVLLAGMVSSLDARQILLLRLWRDLIRSDRAAMARSMLLSGLSPAFLTGMGWAALEEAATQVVGLVNWDGMARQVELDLVLDVSAEARRVIQPTLVIGCELDQMVPVAHSQQLAELIPGARYEELPCGHLAVNELPDEVLRLLEDFLEGDR